MRICKICRRPISYLRLFCRKVRTSPVDVKQSDVPIDTVHLSLQELDVISAFNFSQLEFFRTCPRV